MSVTLPFRVRDETQVADLTHGITREFDLVASVETVPPLITVQLIRAGLRVVGG